MKFTICDLRFTIAKPRVPERALSRSASRRIQIVNRQSSIVNERAFTMMEIAICLAIIGFALVAIIGVLPIGLNTQRDNREETVINQDATVLLEAIRTGARGADYLTNYVYAITNFRATFVGGAMQTTPPIGWNNSGYLTSASNVVGILSTPEFTDVPGTPQPYLPANGVSNHVVAYVRSISGLAAEKPPQDNSLMVGDTFTYRVLVVNAPVAADVTSPFAKQLAANQHELRMTFLWPQLPNGNLGSGRQTFRATVAGQLVQFSPVDYFYQSQSFTNAP